MYDTGEISMLHSLTESYGSCEETEGNMMGGLYSIHFRRHDKEALRPAETILTDNENLVGAPGGTHAGTPSQPQVYMEGEATELC